MTPEEVSTIVRKAIDLAKPFLKEGYLVANGKGELPELWPGYLRARKQREILGPHIVQDEFPEHLFVARAPNQSQVELDWLRNNYKQITLPVFSDLKNTVSRALHDRNWALEFDDSPQGEDVQELVTEGIKEWGSIAHFVKAAGITTMMHDAMGVLTFAPTAIPVIENGEGEMMVDPDGTITPDIHYTVCDDVWGFEFDRWYLLLREERSQVSFGTTTKPWGLVFWLVDDQQIYEVRQVGKLIDWTFEINIWFQHQIGFAPCIHWGGNTAYHRGKFSWESPYLAVQPTLDIALLQEHYLRASEAKCVYPHVVVIGSPCDFVDEHLNATCAGTGQLEWTVNDIVKHKQCPQCHGSGMKQRLSPLGQVVVNPSQDQVGSDSTKIDATNALAFVSPSVDTVRYIWERYLAGIKQARSIMHLDAEAPMAGGEAKTATEAGLNARAKDAFVKPIADRLFVIKDFAILCMGKIRHGSEWEGYTLRPPSHYDLRTDADLMDEIAQAMEKGLPPAIIDYLVWQYVTSRYSNDPEALDSFAVILRADRLQTMDYVMIQAEAAAGRVDAWEILLHFGGMGILERLLAETPSLRGADIQTQVDALIAKAKEEAPQAQAAPNAPLNRLMAAVAA